MSDNKKENQETHLTEDELQGFKEQLLELKKSEEEELESLQGTIDGVDRDADDVQSGRAHHPGDVASDTQMKKTSYALIEKKKKKLDEINLALDRIAAGTYGICTVTGDPIQKERLKAMPQAMHSMDAKK